MIKKHHRNAKNMGAKASQRERMRTSASQPSLVQVRANGTVGEKAPISGPAGVRFGLRLS